LDCAVFDLNSTRGITRKVEDVLQPVRELVQPLIGMEVLKSGLTTGVTFGIIDGVTDDGLTVMPDPENPSPSGEISAAGDSGSLWLDAATMDAVGLHFAGETDPSPAAERAWGKRMVNVASALEFVMTRPGLGDHFYTTSPTERSKAITAFGYQDEGVACYVWPSKQSGTTEFYRLFNPQIGDHFYTTSRDERDNAIAALGYQDEGVACFVSDSEAATTTPLHRLFNPQIGDHFYTTSRDERDNAIAAFDYQDEGIACYVWASQPAVTTLYLKGTTALLRLLKVA
jgi:hypothetical protein